MPPQTNRSTGNVFITGAAAGIGAATARLLSERGYTVFAGIHQDRGSLTELDRVRLVPIDVTDARSVTAAAEQVSGEVGAQGLQALINNAGVIVQGPLELVPAGELRRQFEVNTFGPSYVLQAFLPLLRLGHGRVINISAPTARVPVPFMAPIGASKAALASLSEALRVELAAWRIPVVLIEPGATATSIFDKATVAAEAALAEADQDRVTLYGPQLEAVAKTAARQKPGPVDPVARVVVKAATARRPKRRYTAGRDARLAGTLSHMPGGFRDRLVAIAIGIANVRPAA
jgi:NAD(P)-dependent dehydrogenase (short-subunit alcohol dehydrogenase family)